jgi:hypothetical protein
LRDGFLVERIHRHRNATTRRPIPYARPNRDPNSERTSFIQAGMRCGLISSWVDL